MKYEIVELNIDNIESYVRINALAWKESYKGIVNDEFLEFINTEEEIKRGITNLKNSINDGSKRFLLKVNNQYKGLFKVGKTKYQNYSDFGEIGALYLLNEIKGQGLGKILFHEAKEEIKKMGFNKMILGCLKENPSNLFYIHMGGNFISTNPFILPNQELEENIYIYNDI